MQLWFRSSRGFFATSQPIGSLGPLALGPALVLSTLLTGVALFSVGAWKGLLAGNRPLAGGLQISAIGLACAIVAYLLGTWVPSLLSVHPIG